MAKFKKVSADEARSLRKDHIRDVGGQEVVLKASKPFKAPPSWDAEKRTARFIMTSESVDRYGDIVVQAGLDVTRFLENPQGLVFHNSRSWPIGNWSDVQKILTGRPKRTEGTLNFLPEGVEEDADRAARHVAAGSIKTVSIGFRPDWEEVEMILDDEGQWTYGLKFNKSELLEGSLVPIPAQPDALVKDAGGDWRLAKETIESILDNWVRSPEGLLMPRAAYEEAYRSISVPVTFDGAKISAESRALIKNAFKAIETEELGLEIVEEEITPKADDETENMPEDEEGMDPDECDAEEGIDDEEKGDVGTQGDAEGARDEKTIGSISVEVDTTGIERATEKVTALGKLIDTVSARLTKLFGHKSNEQDPPTPPPPPSAEAIAAAKSNAERTRQRLIEKGLIKA